MRGRVLLLVMVTLGFVATPDVWAERGGRRAGKGGRKGSMRGDPLTDAKRLGHRLKLDEAQQAKLEPLVAEYAQAAQEIRGKAPQDVQDRRRELFGQMREARKAKDREKMKSLMDEMKKLRQEDPTTQELMKLRQDLVAKIEPILRDDQKAELAKITRMGKKSPQQSLDNPGFLRRCVGQLDLRDDQKAELKKIDKEFKEAGKALPKDAPREKRRELGVQYRDEIMKLLDASQKQKLEEIAKQGAMGFSPIMRSPKALEQALETIQLRPDQQTGIDALKERYQADRQAVGKDKKARTELGHKLAVDVVKLLDEDQKKQLMKWRPEKRDRGKKGKKQE